MKLMDVIPGLLVRGAEGLVETVFPSAIYCMTCGAPVDRDALYSVCGECLSKINWVNGKTCSLCGKALEDWYPDVLCGECLSRERSFDRGASCMQYRTLERELIREFKYHGQSYMARNLSEILYDKALAGGYNADIWVPVPMYRDKEAKRGYNQAALLADFTARRLGARFIAHALVRSRNTAPMNKLGARERRRNLDGAFCINPKYAGEIRGSSIMLVDDIYTTGTTMDHCSQVLKAGGAREVTVMSLASGRNQRELPVIKM